MAFGLPVPKIKKKVVSLNKNSNIFYISSWTSIHDLQALLEVSSPPERETIPVLKNKKSFIFLFFPGHFFRSGSGIRT
jgi:hypothetical protein